MEKLVTITIEPRNMAVLHALAVRHGLIRCYEGLTPGASSTVCAAIVNAVLSQIGGTTDEAIL